MLSWARAHRAATAAIVVAAVTLVGLGIYWFAPQRLLLDREVTEALPTPGASAASSGSQTDGSATGGVHELSSGSFTSLEHGTTGTVRIVELDDGSRFVRLEDLETSDGPDLRVYLTDQPLSEDWGVWEDGRYVDLGELKGNLGDSNYRIPDDLDISGFRTAVIWCRRFTVGFGVAPI
jgi:hypothetical protein